MSEKSFIELFEVLEDKFGPLIINQNFGGHKPIEASANLKDAVSKNVREIRLNAFISHNEDIVILGNYDLTFPIYILEDMNWKSVEEEVLKAGLYLLK
ncbi:hypothetical protein [Shewanella xiamenensis]|uniref:hypothetical protein n=1 Tax=Shewanella xiamenensis TaxID=332186 RepID=UPI000849C171|nr:hypothetical protein [Shewanella xiamenensis]ODR86910.1 hypothetical protein ABT47_17300 [Shewanella xiamenensis]